jgi:branched-chain amino acid transport system permease protein
MGNWATVREHERLESQLSIRTREVRHLVLTGLLAGLLLLPLLQVGNRGLTYFLHVMMMTFMYIAIASSWNIISGYAGYISFAHPVFFALGGYFTGALLVFIKLSPFLTAPIAGLLAALLGFGVGLITLRTRGPSFVISTIALLLLARLLLDNWTWLGGSNGISLPLPNLPPHLFKLPFYYGLLFAAAGAVGLSYRIRHSRFGLGLRAIAQDEIRAEVAGIPTHVYKVLAFSLSAFFVAVAGALWGYQLSYLRPSAFLTVGMAADPLLMCLIGGRGTVAGPVLGAVIVVALNELMIALLGSTELNLSATGLIMLLALLFFPGGIIGTLRERGRLPRWLDWD